jgi:hypothetical protein
MSEGVRAAEAAPKATEAADPVLNITFSTGDKTLHTITIRIQRGLSLRVAKMHLLEILPPNVKMAVDPTLKAMGFK